MNLTFYDDEEIEENENLEEDQSEEDELAEGEQDENDAESDTNESENQSEETDDSSSKGTMKGNRHLHGNRQKQIKKINDMMKKQSTNKKGKKSSSRPSKGQRKYIRQQKQNNRREGIESPNKKPGKSKGGGAAAQKRNLRNQQHERRMNPPPKRVDTRTAEEKAEAQRQRSAKKHQELSRKANDSNKKATNTTVKAGAKSGAKAGASATGAGTGAAAGGAGAAGGPACGIILLIVIIIFLLMGIVSFFQNMPDMILGKMYEWFNAKLDRWRIAFGSDPGDEGMVSDADMVDTANYIMDMGYDLKGYGFLAEVETEEDRENNITKQETYYTFLFYDPGEWGPFQTNFMIQYDGNQVWTFGADLNPNNFAVKYIGLGENIDEQKNIISTGAMDDKGWIGHNAEITVRVTKKGDNVEYTKVLQREISGFTLDDSTGIITYEVGKAEYVDSDFIRAYLATDNRTYMFNDGKTLNWFQQLFHGLFSSEAFTKSVHGLINIDTEMVEAIESDSGGENNDNTEDYDGEIHLVRDEKKLYIPAGKEVEEYEPDYIYDLNGWAGKYGKPLEFLLTLHLATMAPDFTYAVAIGDERLDTKVNIKFFQTSYSRRLLLNGEDAEGAYREKVKEGLNQITIETLFNAGATPNIEDDDDEIETEDGANEVETDEIYSFESKTGLIYVNIINKDTGEVLKRLSTSEVIIDGEIIDSVRLEEIKHEILEAFSQYDIAKEFALWEGMGAVLNEAVLEGILEKQDSIYNAVIQSLPKDEYDNLITLIFRYELVRKYNAEHANLTMYIPYIKSVDDHWYRDLEFKDPEAMQGYIVKIDEPGAAPYVENIDDLKKILATYSNKQGASNLVGAADAFMQIQNEYGINALFAASVAIKESSAGTDWDLIDSSTHNWMSTQGSRGGGYKDKNGTTWNRFSSFSEATLAFGELISGESNGNYFGKGYYSVGDIAIKGQYCVPPEGWIKGVCDQMETFLNRAVNELGITLINEENIYSGINNLQDTQNSGDQSAYEIVSGYSAEVGLVANELLDYFAVYDGEVRLDRNGEGVLTVKKTQAADLKQVREPIQYDNSAVIKELLGVVDTRVIKKYTDGETVDVEDEDQLAVFEAKVAEKAKYYIYNGTGINEGEKRQISPTKNSLTAMSILESTKTEDAEHLLKNLRELFNDIGFELEDSSEEQATKYEKNTSLQWIFQRYIPSYEWPSQEETPKTEDNEEGSRYIYKVTAKREGDTENTTNTDEDTDDSSINEATDDITEPDDTTDTNTPTTDTDNETTDTEDAEDTEDTEETVYGFEGGDILVAPGNCVIKKIGEDYLTIQFRNVIKHEIYTKRTWNGSEYVMTEVSTKDMTETELEEYKAKKREELGLADDIDPLWDPEVNGTTLTIFGLEVDSNLKVDETTIIEAGTPIGKTKKGVDIGLLFRRQDLTASDADNEDATENIPSEEDENEDGEKKLAYLSVPRYIYPPEKATVIFDMSKLQGEALEVWNDYSAEITEMAIRYGLDPYAIVAVICVESSGRIDLWNSNWQEIGKVAFGLMQCHVKYHAVPNKGLVDVDGNRVVKDCSPNAMKGNASLQIECGCNVLRSYIFYPWPDGNWFRGLGSYNKGPSGIKNPSTQENFRNGYWSKFKEDFWGGDETWAIKKEGNSYYQIFTNVNTGEISGTVEVAWPPTGSNTLLNGDIIGIAKPLIEYIYSNGTTYKQTTQNITKWSQAYHSNSKAPFSYTDCSTFVTWVAYEYTKLDIFKESKYSGWWMNNATNSKYNGVIWDVVSKNNVQPGDILVRQGHVEIYAGNGKAYSCGGVKINGIHYATGPGTKKCSLNTFTYVIRMR